MAEYKESDDFVNDTTKVEADAYVVEFIDYKKKVAQNFPTLNLSRILAPEEEGKAAKQEITGVDEATTKVSKLEVIVAGGPEEATVAPEAWTLGNFLFSSSSSNFWNLVLYNSNFFY